MGWRDLIFGAPDRRIGRAVARARRLANGGGSDRAVEGLARALRALQRQEEPLSAPAASALTRGRTALAGLHRERGSLDEALDVLNQIEESGTELAEDDSALYGAEQQRLAEALDAGDRAADAAGLIEHARRRGKIGASSLKILCAFYSKEGRSDKKAIWAYTAYVRGVHVGSLKMDPALQTSVLSHLERAADISGSEPAAGIRSKLELNKVLADLGTKEMAWPSRNLGTAAYREGRYEEAATHLWQAHERSPLDARATYWLALALSALGELSRRAYGICLDAVRRRGDLEPGLPFEAILKAVRGQCRIPRPGSPTTELERRMKDNLSIGRAFPDLSWPVRYLGRGHLIKGNYVRARTAFRLAHKISADEPEHALGVAVADFHMGMHEEAIKLLRGLLKFRKYASEANRYLGLCLVRRYEGLSVERRSAAVHLLDEAARALKSALEGGPEAADVLFALGVCDYHLDRTESAAERIDRAVALDPSQIAYSRLLAICLLKLNRWERAEPVLRGALDRSPGDADMELLLASVLWSKGTAEAIRESEQLLEGCLEADPKDVAATLLYARICLDMQRPQRAAGHLAAARRALETPRPPALYAWWRDPGVELALLTARASIQNGHMASAEAALKAAREAGATPREMSFWEATVHLHAGHHDLARAHLERHLTEWPDSMGGATQLTHLLLSVGDPAPARDLLGRLAGRAPLPIPLLLARAKLEELDGNPTAARNTLEAMVADPKRIRVRDFAFASMGLCALGRICEGDGDARRARRCYDRAISLPIDSALPHYRLGVLLAHEVFSASGNRIAGFDAPDIPGLRRPIDQALTHLEKARKLGVKKPRLLLYMGHLLVRRGDVDRAFKVWDHLLRNAPERALPEDQMLLIEHLRARHLLKQGKVGECIKRLEGLLDEGKPAKEGRGLLRYARLYAIRGNLVTPNEKRSQAISALLKKVLAEEPNDPHAGLYGRFLGLADGHAGGDGPEAQAWNAVMDALSLLRNPRDPEETGRRLRKATELATDASLPVAGIIRLIASRESGDESAFLESSGTLLAAGGERRGLPYEPDRIALARAALLARHGHADQAIKTLALQVRSGDGEPIARRIALEARVQLARKEIAANHPQEALTHLKQAEALGLALAGEAA